MARARAALGGMASVRVRLTLWYVFLLVLLLAAFCSFVYLTLSRDLYSEADGLLLDEARGLASALQSGDASNLSYLLADVPAGTIAVLINTETGQVLESQSGSTQAAAALRTIASPATTEGSVNSVTLAGDATWRLATVPVLEDGQTTWFVRVARSDWDVQAALGRLATQMAVAVPVVLVLAIASGLFLAGRALDPIDAITRAAAQIGAEDLGRRLGLRGNDELGRLAATFDGMLDRLEHAF
jgi:methyl-accepting chemotaxis protein